MCVLRSLTFGISLAAIGVASLAAPPVLAASATLKGQTMPAGYGRLAFTFDDAVAVRLRVANAVLILAFSEKVKVDADRIAAELPAFVSVARVDPDGKGLRLALTRPYRANLIEAGDKAFVDLLPENWVGQPPGPPPEVLAELTDRLRRAEARAREIARNTPPVRKTLGLRAARLPTLDRLILAAPEEAQLTHRLEDGVLTLTLDQGLDTDPARIRQALPEGFTLQDVDSGETRTVMHLAIPKDRQVRSFREDDGWTVDVVRPAASPPSVVVLDKEPQPSAAGAPPTPASTEATAPSAAEPAKPQPAATAAAAPAVDPAPREVVVQAASEGDGGRIDFRFPRPTGAAAFVEGGQVTLVFDTRDILNPDRLKGLLPQIVQDATVTRDGKVVLLRLQLKRQQIVRLSDDANQWSLSFGEKGGKPALPLAPRRDTDERGQTIVAVPVPGLTGIHWLDNRDGGLPVAVVTALGPTRAIQKPYRFVEFGLLQSAHGLAVGTFADDVVVRAGAEEALIGRAGGLIVSLDAAPPPEPETKAAKATPPLLDPGRWRELQTDTVRDRMRELQQDVADSSRSRRSMARLNLARFLVANGLVAEAAGPLNALMADDPPMRGNRNALFLKGVIATLMYRDAEALKAFQAPAIKDDAESALWRALVEQRMGRNGPALAGFRRAEASLDSYPMDLQVRFRPAMARAALAMRDTMGAEKQLDKLGELPEERVPVEETALLRAMLDDVAGRPDAALNAYRDLFEAKSRPVAAEAQLRAVQLARAEKRADLSNDEAAARLETVSAIWRGGEIEIEALAELSRIYAEQQRWRDAFQTARRANEIFPEHPLTRRMQDETAQRFEALFSDPHLDQLARVDALALFYDFREFLPLGRRGDEITRLLADRLVELDLLDQAGDMLNYQMERRLTGAARSTLAARLAMVRLMNRKPSEALQALVSTRLVELPADVKRARLLLEVKALSDLSRTDQALDMLEGERGPEVDRLRADTLWTGRRWREAGEAHERILGESWRGEAPLSEGERRDVMRAAIAYVLSDEALSLDRLRTKFAARMAQSSDARLFAFITGASRAKPADIREIARSAAGADTMSDFLKEYHKRYPGYSSAVRPPPAEPQPTPTGDPSASNAGARPGQG